MPIRLNTNRDELDHFNRLEQYSRRVSYIFSQAQKEFQKIAEGLNIDPNKPFSFSQFPQTNKRVSNLINKIVGEVTATMEFGMFQEWEAANNRNDALVDRLFHVKTTKGGKTLARYKERNNEALKAFQERKENGLSLSDRIWKNTKQFQQENELALGVGIGEGKSAAALSRDVRNYLQDPDKLFRRVRDQYGQLQLSQAAEAYHPGQGKYRSSYKNAMRLTRTETNMAYRTSDYTRWQQMDFVVGFEVKLSNAMKHCPVCTTLAGKYPKDYVFKGNHPNCMCYAVSILMSADELDKLEDAILNDEPIDFTSKNEITDIPDGAKKWWGENQHRMSPKSSIPYFLKDNPKYYKGLVEAKTGKTSHLNSYPTTQITKAIPTKVLDLSTVQEAMNAYAKNNKADFARGYAGIKNAPIGSKYFMSTDTKGSIYVNFAENNGFDAGTSLVGAFDKLKRGKALSHHEEYAIEVLWHEVLHNKTKNTTILPSIEDVHGFTRAALETTHQLYARKTYPAFLKKLGGVAKHEKWVLENGFGYAETVNRLRTMLGKLGVDELDFIKKADKLLMADYTGFDSKVIKVIQNMSKRKDDWRIRHTFNSIELDGFFDLLKILD